MNEDRKIVSYDPMTGAPIYEEINEDVSSLNASVEQQPTEQPVEPTQVEQQPAEQSVDSTPVEQQPAEQSVEQPQNQQYNQQYGQQQYNYNQTQNNGQQQYNYGQTQNSGQQQYNYGQTQNNGQQYYNGQYNQQYGQQQYNYGNVNAPKKKNTGLIIGLVVGGVILAIIALVIIFSTLIVKKAKETIDEVESNISEEIESNSNESSNVNSDSTFYGNGFELTYNSKWKKQTATTTDGKSVDVLVYGDNEIYFSPIGQSALSETNVDFTKEDGKKSLYQQFYDYWNKSKLDGKYSLVSGSNSFYYLANNLYYAYMDYGTSTTDKVGRMYLVVDSSNNAILSFRSQIKEMFYTNSSNVESLLRTIKVTTKYDNDLADSLDSMSAWNQYSSVRKSSTLDTTKDINGGWRILSSSEEYWVFNNGEFYWYKSYKDLKDNYWYGKTKIAKGKAGLKSLGLDESKVDQIVANSNGKVTENDIYGIILTPTKIISGGVDKSSTNITGENWNYALVIVDHGSEGLEGQLLNTKSADTSYYVKIKK